MVYNYVHNNHHDATKERFSRLEENFFYLSRNMDLLMEALVNKFEPLKEVVTSKLEDELDEKSTYSEYLQKESKQGPEKEKPSYSAITPSQPLFKMEANVDIKPYHGEIDVVKMNHWLQ
jgi:nicotinic acid phosphoribosyltransferase